MENSKMSKDLKKIILSILIIPLLVFGFWVLISGFNIKEAMAGVSDNVSGWAWSDMKGPSDSSSTIGWVSFNCTNENSCSWTEATSSAAWSAREDHSSVVYNGKMWVMGGDKNWNVLNDVWSSTDGINWTEATSSAAWSARMHQTSVVFKDKMWIIGGWDGTYFNDVWSSTNGKDWTLATSSAAWSARDAHSSVVFNNKMWTIGGWNGTSDLNDVWWSTNGKDWTLATSSAAWSARELHSSVVYNGKMWVMGGWDDTSNNSFNDIWSSINGKDWTLATSSAAWSARHHHSSVVFNNKMWIIGGMDNNMNPLSDVWWSTNGKDWTLATSSAAWSARDAHSSVVFDNKIWTIGGWDGASEKNDVWYSGANYGVNIESDGNITGNAWSENIGWIDFNPAGPYPAAPNYSAQVDLTDRIGNVSGWARALSYGDGWDGWIKMRSLLRQVQTSGLSSGNASVCTVLNDNTIKCWGRNNYGQLGDGTTVNKLTPVTVSGISNAVAVSAGNSAYTCALLNDNTIKCWGFNNYGQLGDGTTVNKLTPVTVIGLSDPATAVSAGRSHTCAVLSTGGIQCWGLNSTAQLGNGTLIDSSVPVTVIGLSDPATAVSAADNHTCAVLSTGEIQCWGLGGNGQLGQGTNFSSFTPVTVSGISNAIAISSGSSHTCAVLSTGGIQCWGLNWRGQLGDGTTNDSNIPVTVSGISNAVAVSAGDSYTCGLLNDNTVKCWGNNERGQLGDGTTVNKLTPVTVFGISNAVAVSAGFWQTCALLNDNTVKCWGFNVWGELGDGTNFQSLSPVFVIQGVYIDTSSGEFNGWAWGDNVVGWVSFNDKDFDGSPGPVDYQVITSFDFNTPPYARSNSATSTEGYCISKGTGQVSFDWTYEDYNDDNQDQYWLQIATDSGYTNLIVDSTSSQSIIPGGTGTSFVSVVSSPTAGNREIGYNDTYWWRIKVHAATGNQDWSAWEDGPAPFTTPVHAYPYPDFVPVPQAPSAGEIVEFIQDGTDSASTTSYCYNGGEHLCEGDSSASYEWDFDNNGTIDSTLKGNATTTYPIAQSYTAKLKITDLVGSCSATQSVGATLPLPEWKEIPPFSASPLNRFLAMVSESFGPLFSKKI